MATVSRAQSHGSVASEGANPSETVQLPSDIFAPSTFQALKSLLHVVFLCVLGSYAISVSPWYLWWAGALLSGIAMSWLYTVGWDCAQRCFFRSRTVNHIVGVVCTLPMLRPFSSLRFKELRSLYSDGDWRRNTMPIVDLTTVCLFAAIFFPLLIYYTGVIGLVKYWLVPFLDMHFRIGTFTANVISRIPYLALFHPEIKPLLPATLKNAKWNFPSYNIIKAHPYIASTSATALPWLSALTAPLNSVAFGRLSLHDTPAVAYCVGVLVGASAIYHRTFASVLLVPTLCYIAWALPVRTAAMSLLRSSSKAPRVNAHAHTPATSATESPKEVLKPHWFNRIYLGLVHVLSVWAVFHMYYHFNWMTIALLFGLYHFAAVGITAGAHRLWAHRSYQASASARCLMMVQNLFTNQGSIFKWVRDHRLHHKFVDTDMDPHNSNKGFWWSHCGWLMYQKPKAVIEAGNNVYMDDIKQDPFVMWQSENYKWAAPLCCFALPGAVAALWGDALGGFLIAGYLRYMLTLHATWFVNSLAHMYGYKPYMPNIRPCENFFVALCADGEGWHNYHHAYPYDYSTNEYGVLQYNPTTLYLDVLHALGLVSNRRRAVMPNKSSGPVTLPVWTRKEFETISNQAASVVLLDNYVYDLNTFEDLHPAGSEILKKYYGKDVTEAFHGGVHKHTEVAINMLESYRVARLDPEDHSQ